MLSVVRPWPRLPSKVGGVPSLEPFQARLDGALSNLSQVKLSLLTAGGLDFEGPFQPKPFCGSVKSKSQAPVLWRRRSCARLSLMPLLPRDEPGCAGRP